MDKKKALKLGVSLGITFTLAIIFFAFTHTKTYQILELKALDLRFVLKGNKVSSLPIVHIDIDDQSLSILGRWPWPRAYHAKLITLLKECQAKQVLFDVLFLERQKDNPKDDERLTQALGQSGIVYLPFYFSKEELKISDSLRQLLIKDISVTLEDAARKLGKETAGSKEQFSFAKKYIIDEAVSEVIRKDPNISIDGLLQQVEESRGWLFFSEEEAYVRDSFEKNKAARFFVNKFGIPFPSASWPFGREDNKLNVPLREYYLNTEGSGFINADADIDGVTRKVPLFIRYEDVILPQLTVAALMESLGVKEIAAEKSRIIFKNAHRGEKVSDIAIPVDARGRVLVNWQGRWESSFKHIPYYLILSLQEIREQLSKAAEAIQGLAVSEAPSAENSPERLRYLKENELALKTKLTGMIKDKVCIIGLTATGTHDLRPVPVQENYPMVGLHSNLIHTILTEDFIREKRGGLNIIIFFVTALFVAFCSLVKLSKSVFLSLGYCLAYALASCFVFIFFGWWIDFVGPLGIVVFGFSGVTSFRFFTEEKEKLWIRQAFSHYLSKEVINELMDDPSRLKLGGERRNISVFFSDVRGFTSFSESAQPEEVVARLNEILTAQVGVVFKSNGTLDKFVGDELMAFFGAPGIQHKDNHALVAVRVAVEIQETLKRLQAQWAGEGKAILQIGIGINTGDMVVGNMGSLERMDFTVIGDNVNLAARLCSAAGKDEIIISEATYNGVKDHIEAVKLEPIMVKGKANAISIYKVVGLRNPDAVSE